jgi:hypothetical protein
MESLFGEHSDGGIENALVLIAQSSWLGGNLELRWFSLRSSHTG